MKAKNKGVRDDPTPRYGGPQEMTCQGSDTQAHSDRNADLSFNPGRNSYAFRPLSDRLATRARHQVNIAPLLLCASWSGQSFPTRHQERPRHCEPPVPGLNRTRTLNLARHREAAGRGDPCILGSWIAALRSQ